MLSDRHLTERSLQKVFEEAGRRAGIVKKGEYSRSETLLRHSFAGKRDRSMIHSGVTRSYECMNNLEIYAC